jgi:RAB protein geranylgeranyltransferase component A
MDPNQYYGGSDAAFSLDEAQEWVEKVHKGEFPVVCAWLVRG